MSPSCAEYDYDAGYSARQVRTALKGMQLSPVVPIPDADHDEDPTLAARLDDQLDDFWEG